MKVGNLPRMKQFALVLSPGNRFEMRNLDYTIWIKKGRKKGVIELQNEHPNR